MQSNETILIRIRKALLKQQMTQRDLANALGKKEAEISRWMSGRMGISDANLTRIEEVLGIALTREKVAREKRVLLKLGVVGTGSIARRFVAEAPYVENVYMAAAYNPDHDETHAFCQEFGIPVDARSYEELIRSVDAVYIASPYYTHYDYAMKALMADRHVLCEIPLTESHARTQELYATAERRGLVFMTALKTAYAPSYSKIVEEARSGAIGEIVDVTASVTTMLTDEHSIGYNNERMCENTYYALFIMQKLIGSKMTKVNTFVRRDEERLQYFNAAIETENAIANIKIGTGVKSESSLVIAGTRGYIYVPAPWWKPDYFEIRYENPYDNKKMYFPYESSGLRYEIKCFSDNITMQTEEHPIAKEEVLRIAQFVDKHMKI